MILIYSPQTSGVCDKYVAFAYSDYDQVDAFVEQIVAQKPNERRTELSDEDRMAFEVAGKLGEVAFSRHFGWPVDWDVRLGGDDWDFELSNGETVDVKSVPVERNMDYDFGIPIGEGESPATYYVQVLISPDREYGVITGGISRERFHAIAREEAGWEHRGDVRPNVVNRSQLSQSWPECFYLGPAPVAIVPRKGRYVPAEPPP